MLTKMMPPPILSDMPEVLRSSLPPGKTLREILDDNAVCSAWLDSLLELAQADRQDILAMVIEYDQNQEDWREWDSIETAP